MKAGAALAAILVLTTAALAQNGRWDVSIGAMGALSKQSTGNQVVLTPTQSAGVFATAQFRIAPRLRLQANLGHFDNSQKYQTTSLLYRVQSTVTEVSGGLVFRPFSTPKWRTFVFGGGGILVFNPDLTTVISPNPVTPSQPVENTQNIGAIRQTVPVILYGGGADRALLPFLALRIQYRGLFYNNPSYGVGFLFTGTHGHVAEPSIGLVLRF